LPPLLRLEGQPRCYVGCQTRLVVLDDEDVVALALDDLLGHVALAEHGVAGEDAAPQGQDAQQLERGLVFVGLGINSQLGQDGLGGGRVGGDEVVAGGVAVSAAACGLAVEADVQALAVGQARGDPAGEGGLEGGHVEAAEEVGEGGLAEGLAVSEAQDEGEEVGLFAAELGDGEVTLAAGEHGENDEGKDGRQRVADALGVARVGDLGKHFEQGKGG
jgi:hypothetical protein